MNLEDLVRLRRAKDVMDRDYARPLDVPALAKVALMSSGHFSRSFRAAYGETPYNYLMTRRVERAKALLRRGDMSVTEVCFAVGCTSLGSFSSRFTELVGESPSAYRARDHGAGAGIPACVAKIHTRPVKNGEPALAPEGPGKRTGDRAAGANGSSGAAGKPVTIGEADAADAS
ncbi:helix-turn-helix transcriptional regulator [Streptomyces sp. NPDC053474]|uniref:helix-turn-helix transcriptional regulator n=1 Tax=Streptomyces sp. NPDC053474 TaxID=3365704 RepID=UPI0037D34892